MYFQNHLSSIKESDPQMHDLIEQEIERQETGLELIPSECIASFATMEALGSVLTNKYSEGYPGKRYYGGNEVVDKVERLTQERAKEAFGVPHANVQPYSGSPANFAVYNAVCEAGDTIMGHSLPDGGHLTHGCPASATAKYFNAVQYHVKADGFLDMEEVRSLAREHKPKLIWIGATAYSREFPFEEFTKIADEVGAYLAADVAHISGLIIGGVHTSPVPHVHIVTTTTHKTLRGPRGGMILVTERGLDKDPELAKKVDQSIFPNLQGGPHNHQIAGIGVALGEALKPEFKDFAANVVGNAKALAAALTEEGFKVISGGTDNHLMLLDCGKGRGVFFQDALDAAGITLNKNTIPQDPSSPFYPSGVRLGTPIVTQRGLRSEEMEQIAIWFRRVWEEISEFEFPEDKKERITYLKEFKKSLKKNENLIKVREEVRELCIKFPLYTDGK